MILLKTEGWEILNLSLTLWLPQASPHKFVSKPLYPEVRSSSSTSQNSCPLLLPGQQMHEDWSCPLPTEGQVLCRAAGSPGMRAAKRPL